MWKSKEERKKERKRKVAINGQLWNKDLEKGIVMKLLEGLKFQFFFILANCM